MSENCNTLPSSWIAVKVGQITLPISTTDPRQSPDRQFTYLDISGINNETNKIASVKSYLGKDAPSRARQIVRTNDILFSTVRTYLKNIAKVTSAFDGQVASTGFCILRPASGINPDFLFYQTLTPAFLSPLADLQRGSSYPAVRDTDVREQVIVVPPLSEQRRIVSKIEELFSELDEGIESLKTSREQIKVYRQALLKHAFEGKLTADWREENKHRLESAEALHQRIKTDRAERYEQQLAEWEATGKQGSKPKVPKELPPLTPEELDELPELPEGWIYSYLADLGDLGRGKSKHRPRNDPRLFGGTYPFVQTGEVKAANRIIRQYSTTYSEFGLQQSKLWPTGTLCITIAANIAETAFLGFDGCFPDSVVGFLAFKNIVVPEYIDFFIRSVRTRIEAYAPATAQKNINLETLENLVVPYCCNLEQDQILTILEERFSIIDQFDQTISNSLQQAEAMRQAILKKAFSGQLVPQDLGDEPASALLARIKVEKAAPNVEQSSIFGNNNL